MNNLNLKDSSALEMFKQFLEMIEKNNAYCDWIKEQTVNSYLPELKSELLELEQGIEASDNQNIKEEIADILYDVFVLAKLAENEYNTDFKELFQMAVDKIKRRKPYIFENRSVSREEAAKYWQEAKLKEKALKNN